MNHERMSRKKRPKNKDSKAYRSHVDSNVLTAPDNWVCNEKDNSECLRSRREDVRKDVDRRLRERVYHRGREDVGRRLREKVGYRERGEIIERLSICLSWLVVWVF